jgi:hypothetical protein
VATNEDKLLRCSKAISSAGAILLRTVEGGHMHKKVENERVDLPGRILARTLADEILSLAVGGTFGPTTIATGGNSDMTNGTGDNDGPHVPPPA